MNELIADLNEAMLDDIQWKIEGVWGGRQPRPPALTWLFALAVAIHGPVDVAVTMSAWHLESNAVVIALGPWRWLAVKVLILASAAIAYWVLGAVRSETYRMLVAGWLGIIVGLGIGLVIPNLAVIGRAVG